MFIFSYWKGNVFHLNPDALFCNMVLWSLYASGSSNMEYVNAGVKSRLDILRAIRFTWGEDWTSDSRFIFFFSFFFLTSGNFGTRQFFHCIPKFFFFGYSWSFFEVATAFVSSEFWRIKFILQTRSRYAGYNWKGIKK